MREEMLRLTKSKNKLYKPYSGQGENQYPLIPVIWGDVHTNIKEDHYNNCLLIKIRILQLVKYYKEKSLEYYF